MTFAAPKTRLEDQRYIEAFDVNEFEAYLNCQTSTEGDRDKGKRGLVLET